MPKKYKSDVMAAIHETASDLHRVGGMDQMGAWRKASAGGFAQLLSLVQKKGLEIVA